MAILYTKMSRWKFLLQKLKSVIYLFYSLALMGLIIPFLTLISSLIRLFAILFSYLDPSLGRFSSYLDVWMDEDFTNNFPRSSIITTMTLNGHLPLEQLKSLFTNSILEIKLSKNPEKLRYPELQQYLTSFMGFRIWKKDPNFSIDNHIFQRYHQQGPLDLQQLHEEMMNKPYKRNSSPWEILLIQNSSSPGNATSTLAVRFHHSMIDGKSILKMLVECLGNKPLKTAKATAQKTSLLLSLKFWLAFPFNYLYQNCIIFYQLCMNHTHPLKNHYFRADKYSKLSVTFTPKFQLSDLKQIAKKNHVTSSSVVMSLVTGAVRKCGPKFADRGVVMGYPLPKENHPEFMANHVYMGIISLPTQEPSILGRLKKCDKIFLDVKATQACRYTNLVAMQTGLLAYPLSKKLPVNHFLPMFCTNIAGDEEGFGIGGNMCEDFRMSVGTLEGVAGLLFCVFSYKDGIRFGITARESVLSREQTNKIVEDIQGELKSLMEGDTV